MEMLLESPWPYIWTGVLALVLLGVAFFNTRHPKLLSAMAGVLVVTLLLVLMEWAVVTDRESVENTLEDVALALESNDLDRVMAYMSPTAGNIRNHAQMFLPRIEVSDANVGGDLKVTINRLTSPPTARAEFTGRISFKGRSPGEAFPYDNFVRKFAIKLRQSGDGWLLDEYESQDIGGLP